MKKYSRTTASIYGLISLLVIIGIIYAVSFSMNISTTNRMNATNLFEVTSAIPNSTAKVEQKIYNPYENVNFDTFSQVRTDVLSDANIAISDVEFSSVFSSDNDYSIDNYSAGSTEEFLEDIKSTEDIFAIGDIYNTGNSVRTYISLVKNKNIIGLKLEDGKNLGVSIKVWDDVLTEVMPQLTVFGISHEVVLITENSNKNSAEISEYDAIISGHYFAIGNLSGEGSLPEIKSISVKDGVIKIDAENFIRIEWITENGKISGYGEEINPYSKDIQQWNTENESVTRPSKYVRAIIIGENGILYTQAFGLR